MALPGPNERSERNWVQHWQTVGRQDKISEKASE